MNLQYKEFPGQVVSHDDKNLTLTHFISTETQDSGGDIMLADGMTVRGKAVVLFQHGQDPVYGNEPIAKPLKFEAGTFQGKKGILATTQYWDGRHLAVPDFTGQKLYEKARDDFMPNWSIGFNSTKEHPVKGGRVVDEWELHEYSQVAVGMNKEATTLALKAENLPHPVIIIKEETPAPEKKEEPKPELSVVPEQEKKNETPEPERKGAKAPHLLAHKGIHAFHKEMMDDLKEAAESDDLMDKGVEGRAKEALEDFADNAEPHVAKYIKAVREMEKDDELPSMEGTEEPERKDYSAPHRMLHKVRDDMIKAIHAHKGDKSVVPGEAAKTVLKDHHEAALPHAKAFIKGWMESHSAEHKPEADPAAPAEKVLKLYKPQAKTFRLSTKATPKPAITAELVQKLVADGLKEWTNSFREEMRRLSGKVTK